MHFAAALVQRGHDVMALTASTNTRPTPIRVARDNWSPRSFEGALLGRGKTYAEMMQRGEVVAAAAIQLRDRHRVMPDIVFGTPGWGETLLLKEVWPNAQHVMYGEFFYGPYGRDVGFDPEFEPDELSARMTVRARNAHLLVAMDAADKILSPTAWQAASFPSYIQGRISVIHDGIDTDRIQPGETAVAHIPGTSLRFAKGDEVITFINRNLEPHRGYHIFMRALPKVLAARPNAHVVIIGGTCRHYRR
jgi:glycosyltransferase involved in cell wall biosynthesis